MPTFAKLICAFSLLTMAGIGSGQVPVENINPDRHPNLAAAQALSREAFDRLSAAQEANEFDLDGHAARAKDLLRQASEEMKLAAQTANRRR